PASRSSSAAARASRSRWPAAARRRPPRSRRGRRTTSSRRAATDRRPPPSPARPLARRLLGPRRPRARDQLAAILRDAHRRLLLLQGLGERQILIPRIFVAARLLRQRHAVEALGAIGLVPLRVHGERRLVFGDRLVEAAHLAQRHPEVVMGLAQR